MPPTNMNRWIVFFSGAFANLFSWGIIWMAASGIGEIHTSIAEQSDFIKINFVELWVPVGFIGVGLISLVSPSVAIFTGKRSDYVWGEKGSSIANYVIIFFVVLGFLFAVYFYQSIKGSLDEKGYVYCRPVTMLSEITQHERVYVAKPALCVKPSNTR